MRKMTLILAGMATMMAAPLSAELQNYASSGNWHVYSDDHDCTMSAEFERSGYLSLDYDHRKDSVTVRMEVPQTQSLKTGDEKELKIIFTDGTLATFDDGWGNATFTAFKVEGRTLMTSKFSGQFLTDFSKYKLLGIFYKDIVINSYDLAGSGNAVALLRRCSASIGRENPSDPFDDKSV